MHLGKHRSNILWGLRLMTTLLRSFFVKSAWKVEVWWHPFHGSNADSSSKISRNGLRDFKGSKAGAASSINDSLGSPRLRVSFLRLKVLDIVSSLLLPTPISVFDGVLLPRHTFLLKMKLNKGSVNETLFCGRRLVKAKISILETCHTSNGSSFVSELTSHLLSSLSI